MDLPRGMASRRSVLAAVVTASGLVLVPPAAAYAARLENPGSGPDEPTPHHDVTQLTPDDLVPPDGLDPGVCGSTVFQHSELLGMVTPYEETASPMSFSYNDGFYARCESWFQFFRANTPTAWGPPFEIWSWGVYVNKGDGCKSFHNLGRAFDLTHIYATDPATGKRNEVFNARHDQWISQTGSTLATTRKRYWGTAASVNYHFRSALTYFYNDDHNNHLHFDNGLSGSANSSFATDSDAQVEHVQAALTYVWGETVDIDGVYGPKSSAAAGRVLSRIGRSGALTTQANWLEFNRATLRFASGTQAY
jgi:hypothetical protein